MKFLLAITDNTNPVFESSPGAKCDSPCAGRDSNTKAKGKMTMMRNTPTLNPTHAVTAAFLPPRLGISQERGTLSSTCLPKESAQLARVSSRSGSTLQPFALPVLSTARVAGGQLPLWGPTVMAVAALKRIIEISTASRIMRVKTGKAVLLRDTDVIDTNDDCERRVVRPTLAS